MALATVLSRDYASIVERRSRPRETLQCVVLVYFENENWGKLVEINEDGMSLEFSQSPPLRQRIRFNFQVMGCMPMPRAGEVFGETFEADGEVIWTREFERLAGVRFLDLADATREQIQRWVSFGKPAEEAMPVLEVEAKPEADLTASPQSPEDSTSIPVTLDEVEAEETVSNGIEDCIAQAAAEPDQQFAVEALAALKGVEPTAHTVPGGEAASSVETVEIPALEESTPPEAESLEPQWESQSKHPVARAALIALGGCAAAIAVFLGARLIVSYGGRASESVRQAPTPVPGPRTGGTTLTSAESPLPFQVEVQDASGKRWLLWFVRSASQSSAIPIAAKTAVLARPYPAAEKNPSSRDAVGRDFIPAAPRTVVKGAATSGSKYSPAEAPILSAEFATSLVEPVGSGLASPVAPPPAIEIRRSGGDVQQPRLIRSVPPEYPALAKTTHVSGDVVLDALIDPAGNVTGVTLVSGPLMLRQAAIEALRQWKYEPARLNGQAVAMHLSVTLKFHAK